MTRAGPALFFSLLLLIAGCTTVVVQPPNDTNTTTVGPECAASSGCFVGGCSGQLCTARESMASTCEWAPVYACYKLTSCGCVNGKCAWRESPEFKGCVDAAKSQQQRPQQEQPQ